LAPPGDAADEHDDEPGLELEPAGDGVRQPNPRASRKRKKRNRR
jgi:hypothetical protein